MKAAILIGIGIAIAGVGSAVYLKVKAPPSVAISVNMNGLTSVKVNSVEFLQNGDFRVDELVLKNAKGETSFGATNGSHSFDQKARELTISYPWGVVKTTYFASGNKLTLDIETINKSDDIIEGIHFTPLTIKFPGKVKEYDGSIPLLIHNIGQVASVPVSYGSGSMTVVGEDLQKEVMVGLPWALDKPTNTQFPLSVHTNRVSNYPDSYPKINRPIPPGASDRFVVSLRFGRSKSADSSLATDVTKKFADAFPQQLNWKDRRPIGAIFIATGPQNWSNNPRGWFGDAKLDITTPAGRTEFRKRVLEFADGSIKIMHNMGAQGAITWDIEGQQFHHATTYIGDPRMLDTLAPEMAEVADEYFARFRKAGLRAGICVRPQLLSVSADKRSAEQGYVSDPASLLIEKIGYAKKRWGVTLIYIDSNVNGNDPNPLDASIIQKVHQAFPDCLLIPEHSTLRYYAYSAPFAELRHGTINTPNAIHQVYPQAFSAIYTADGPLDFYRDGLKEAVKRGDSLMYRTWFQDPQNDKVRAIYQN